MCIYIYIYIYIYNNFGQFVAICSFFNPQFLYLQYRDGIIPISYGNCKDEKKIYMVK